MAFTTRMNNFGLMWAKVDTFYPDVLHLMLQTAKYLKLFAGNLDNFLFGDALLPMFLLCPSMYGRTVGYILLGTREGSVSTCILIAIW
jgi:hypothetical protein